MACNTPVVATRVGGSAEFLHDDVNCLAFEPGDHAALAAALRRLAGDASLRHRLVRAGRATVEVLDVERLADVMEAWHVYEARRRVGPVPARRDGVPRSPTSLRLVGDRQAVVSTGVPSSGAVRLDADRLPVRTGGLRAVCLRTDGDDDASARLASIADELVRAVDAGGTVAVEAPNPSDLRLVRARVQARWKGWKRRPRSAAGALERSAVTDLLSRHGDVVRSGTGAWMQTRRGRLVTRVLRLAKVSDRGPRTEVEVRRP
jgi:hypothetical protein